MSYQTPCADRKNNPDDWFISRDGKQYPDDDLVNEASLNAAADLIEGFDKDDLEAWEALANQLEDEARKDALRRRRHARDKCHTECYFRTQCLGLALEGDQMHGTWGGYYEEELREIRKEIARRKRIRRANEN